MGTLINNIFTDTEQQKTSIALGIRLVLTNEIVAIAKNAGYSSLFIDLEHSYTSLEQCSQLCAGALAAEITPLVRVPYQCGNGFVQRVLDGGAMGVIFPHISTVDEAKAAVEICKFPVASPYVPKKVNGKRSLTAALPHFNYRPTPASKIMRELDACGSLVCLMVETRECYEHMNAIAAVPGVDMLLIGANDLSLALGIQGQWDHIDFKLVLKEVSEICKKHGKLFGLAGIYDRPDIMKKAVVELGAKYILGNSDFSLLAGAAKENVEMLQALKN